MKRTTTSGSVSPVHPTPRAERYWLRLLAATLRVSIRPCPEHTRFTCASNRTAGNVSAGGVIAAGATLWLLACPGGLKADPAKQLPSSSVAEINRQNQAGLKSDGELKNVTARPCQSKTNAGPEMVLIAAGSFTQGSTKDDPDSRADETPTRTVTIDYDFAIGRCEVTVAEFRQFVEDIPYRTEAEQGDGCYTFDADIQQWARTKGTSWQNPGFKQTDDDPVVCISWHDANAYIDWLNQRLQLTGGKAYRLPTESEWEYAARAGTQTPYFWGNDSPCDYANGADQSLKDSKQFPQSWPYADCRDNFINTSPVATFKANVWGLYDMSGNVWEWVEDCWHDNYVGAPSDGSAWLDAKAGDCKRSVRGGSWVNLPVFLRSALRDWYSADVAFSNIGFRLARTL